MERARVRSIRRRRLVCLSAFSSFLSSGRNEADPILIVSHAVAIYEVLTATREAQKEKEAESTRQRNAFVKPPTPLPPPVTRQALPRNGSSFLLPPLPLNCLPPRAQTPPPSSPASSAPPLSHSTEKLSPLSPPSSTAANSRLRRRRRRRKRMAEEERLLNY
jgi:hypothetical protein